MRIRYRCPYCRAEDEAPEAEAGEERTCRRCEARVAVPRPPAGYDGALLEARLVREPAGAGPRFPWRILGLWVVAIFIALGIGLGLLVVLWSVRERALREQCASHLHCFGCALVQYASDYDQEFPSVTGFNTATGAVPLAGRGEGEESLWLTYPKYCPDAKILRCPTTSPRDSVHSATDHYRLGQELCSYGYDPRHQYTDKPGVAIMADQPGDRGVNSPNHWGAGQNVLYIDGHCEWTNRTNVGYNDDEIYADGAGTVADPREDSWIVE